MTLKTEMLTVEAEKTFKEGIENARGDGSLKIPEDLHIPRRGGKITFVLPHPVFAPSLEMLKSANRLRRMVEPDYWQVVLRSKGAKESVEGEDGKYIPAEFFGSARIRASETQQDKWDFTGFNYGKIDRMIAQGHDLFGQEPKLDSRSRVYRIALIVSAKPRLTALWARFDPSASRKGSQVRETEKVIAVIQGNGNAWHRERPITLTELADGAKMFNRRGELREQVAA